MKSLFQHILKISLLSSVTLAFGCVSMLTGSPKTQTLFVLNPQTCEVPPKPGPGPSILIAAPKASSFIYSSKIIFSRDEQTRGAYQYAFWNEPPPDRIGQAFEKALRCSGKFSVVSRNSFSADYLVRFELNDFRHDIKSEPGKVVVNLSLEILNARSGALVGKQDYYREISSSTFDAAGAVASFDEAVKLIISEMTNYLVDVTLPKK